MSREKILIRQWLNRFIKEGNIKENESYTFKSLFETFLKDCNLDISPFELRQFNLKFKKNIAKCLIYNDIWFTTKVDSNGTHFNILQKTVGESDKNTINSISIKEALKSK